MNAALLLMSSAWMAGADTPAPAPAPAPAPYVAGAPAYAPGAAYGSGVGGCGCGSGISAGCADPYVSTSSGRSGLFGKLKGLCHRNNNDCGCGPVYTGFTTAACDTGCGCGSGSSRQGLFSRLRSLCHRNNSGCCDTWGGSIGGGCGTCGGCGSVSGYGAPAYGAPGVGGCALPPLPGTVPPTTPAQPPTNMPAPTPKKGNKNGTSSTSAELPRLSPAGSQLPAVSVPNPF